MAALPKMEEIDTQTETDQLVEYLKSQMEQLTANVESLQTQNAAQQESLDNISSENTYLQVLGPCYAFFTLL